MSLATGAIGTVYVAAVGGVEGGAGAGEFDVATPCDGLGDLGGDDVQVAVGEDGCINAGVTERVDGGRVVGDDPGLTGGVVGDLTREGINAGLQVTANSEIPAAQD